MSGPQSVVQLMAEYRADWQRQIAVCDDATRARRQTLYDQLVALEAAYGTADFPRREVMDRELRQLSRDYLAMPLIVAPEPEPEPEPIVASVAKDEPASAPSAPEAEPFTVAPAGAQRNTASTADRASVGAVDGGVLGRVTHWWQWGYGEAEYQALCRKREVRLSELGGRMRNLGVARPEAATGDASVAQILDQLVQVDAAIAANRLRREHLRPS